MTTVVSVPEIAVCIPSHNRPARLRRLLDALAEQTFPADRFEIVVAHDSRDAETEELLRTHPLAQAGTLRHLTFAPDSAGPAAKRNAAWRATGAPLVAFTDDDCEVAPDWLERGQAVCAAHPGAVVQGRVDPNPREAHLESFFTRTLRVHAAGPYFQTCNLFYPRDLLERLDGFDETFQGLGGEDTDLAWRAKEQGAPVAFADDARAYHAVAALSARGRLRVAQRWSSSMLVYVRHPALRQEVFLYGVFYRPAHYFLLFALPAVLVPRGWWPLRWFFLQRYCRFTRQRLEVERGTLRHAPLLLAEDLFELGGLVRASIRHRTPML